MIKNNNISLIDGFKKYLFLILILSIATAVLEAASLSSIGGLVYTFLNDSDILKNKISSYEFLSFIGKLDDAEFLNLIIISIFLLFVIKNLIKLVNSFLETSIIKRIHVKNSALLFKKYIDLDLLQFTKKNLNEILNDVSSETIRASKFVDSAVILLKEIILVTILLTTLLVINLNITLLSFLTILILIFLYSLVFKNKSKYFGNKITESQKIVLKNTIEPFQIFKFLKMFDKKFFFERKLIKALQDKIKFEIKQSMILKYPSSYFELSFLIILLFIFYIFYKNGTDINTALPFLSVLVLFSLRLINSFINIYNSVNNLKFYKNSLINIKNKIKSLKIRKRKKIIPINFHEIELKNLSFKYPNSQNYILKNLNLKIEKNKVLGLFGPSGCGKSTLLDIILGLLKPTKGRIFLNKREFSFYNFHINKFFSYIPQKSYLINDTIQNNINFGNDSNLINKNKLISCLKRTEIYKFIKSLPKGIKTICKDGGKNFSGGQVQRIALARALYINHEILIMDESTVSLDGITENKIFKNIIKDKSQTIVFVSHNKKLKKFCDYSIEFPSIKRTSIKLKNKHLLK